MKRKIHRRGAEVAEGRKASPLKLFYLLFLRAPPRPLRLCGENHLPEWMATRSAGVVIFGLGEVEGTSFTFSP